MSFYLTTPIYYVNSTPHIGHAYTTIAADILVRHHRQRGDETFFLTGVDEHATKVSRVAAGAGARRPGVRRPDRRSSGASCRRGSTRRSTSSSARPMRGTSGSSRSSCSGSTTTATSTRTSTPACTASAARRSRPRTSSSTASAPTTTIAPEWIEEKNYFFRLSAYQDRLLALYDERPDFVLPGFRYNEARSFIAGGLQDFSISRAGQTWGIPIPWDPEPGRLRLGRRARQLPERAHATRGRARTCATFWPARGTCSAKDILRFHCVYWPAMLLAAGYEVPQQLFVHGYLLLDDQKISKSLGNVIDPLDLIDVYGVDPVRFWARARRLVRPGRQRLARRHPRALRARARQRPRQPALADDRDDRALPRRRAAGPRPTTDGELAAALDDRCRTRSRPRSTRFDITGALERSGRSCAASTATSSRRSPGSSRRTTRAQASSTACSTTSPTASAPSAIALSRVPPRDGAAILAALGQPHRRRLGAACAYGRTAPAPGSRRRRRSSRASTRPPRRDRVIDTHAHLDACEDAGRRARAGARGRCRAASSRSAPGIDSCRAALALAASERRCLRRARASIRTRRATDEAARVDELGELLGHERAVAVGETGLDYHYGAAPRGRAARLFEAQLELARRIRPAGRHPHARRRRRHRRGAARLRRHRRPALLLGAGAAGDRRSSAATTSRSPATSRIRRRRSCATRPREVPADRHPRRDRQPVPRAAAAARRAERAGLRRPHGRRARRGARRGRATSSPPGSTRTRPRLSACAVSVSPKKRSASTSSSTRTSSA